MKKLRLTIGKSKSTLSFISANVIITDLITNNCADFIYDESMSKAIMFRLESEKDLQLSERVVTKTETVLTWEN